MKTNILIFALLCIALTDLSCQIIFQHRFRTTTNDQAASMRVGDGKYLISGSRLSVISSDGEELLSVDDGAKRGSFLAQDGFVTATNSYFGSPSISVGHLVWYNDSGEEQRAKRVDDALWRNLVDDIIPLEDGDFVYAGRHSTVAGSGAILRKIDSSGNQLWESRWNSGEWIATFAEQIFQFDSFLYVIGVANATNIGNGPMRDMFVSQHRSSTGELINDVLVRSDSIGAPTDLHILNDSTVLLIGNTNSNSANAGSRGVLHKIDLSGSIVWTQSYTSPFIEEFQGIETTPIGGYLILGNRTDLQSDSIYNFVKKIDENGLEEWEYTFPNMDIQQVGLALIRESNSDYTIGGHVGNGVSKDYYIQKFDITNLVDSAFVGSSVEATHTEQQIKLYPNPVLKQLHIDLSNVEHTAVTFTLFDITGQCIHRGEFHAPKFSLNTTNLSEGNYFITFQLNDQVVVKRFVVL